MKVHFYSIKYFNKRINFKLFIILKTYNKFIFAYTIRNLKIDI